LQCYGSWWRSTGGFRHDGIPSRTQRLRLVPPPENDINQRRIAVQPNTKRRSAMRTGRNRFLECVYRSGVQISGGVLLVVSSTVMAYNQPVTTRDIYSTPNPPGTNLFALATIGYTENGCQAVTTDSRCYSPPYGIRLKLTANETRDIVGIRFINPNWTLATYNITPQMKLTGFLEFWFYPQGASFGSAAYVPSFSVEMTSSNSSNGEIVETRLPLTNYLARAQFTNAWSLVRIPFSDFSDSGFYYNPSTGQSVTQAFVWSQVTGINFFCDTTSSGYYDPSVDDIRFDTFIQPLVIHGQDITTTNGTPVRFWGVNLCSVYPTHEQAENLAADLDSMSVNLARQQHNLRNSLDWNTRSGVGSLAAYNGNTRTPNTNAWDRFDYLNAQLRDHGIYLLFSLHGSRVFQTGDVDIVTTNPGDRTIG